MSPTAKWELHTYSSRETQLGYAKLGQGEPVVFLHGGPGDDHSYLRPFAEPFADAYTCVLPDQRGSGLSKSVPYNSDSLHLSNFIQDIETLRLDLGRERLRIVGHSWGASLGLYYGLTYPHRIERLALVGMGPIDDEMTSIYSANLFNRFTPQEREELKALRAKRNQAGIEGNEEVVKSTHIEVVTRFFSRCWVYNDLAREKFISEFQANCSYNRQVPTHLMPTVKQFPLLESFPKLTAPVLVMYGYQDIEPITQAFVLKRHLKAAQITFLNECGHLPWLDQPSECRKVLKGFLA